MTSADDHAEPRNGASLPVEHALFDPPPEGWTSPPDWPAVFGRPAPLAVEIGPGKGIFLTRIASAHPEWNFVAIELRRVRVNLCARKVAEAGLVHVRLVEGRAEERTRVLFGPGAVRTWYVNFPDPWPKRRHRGRRLVQPGYVALLAERTEPGGIAYLATDDADYAGQMLAMFEADGSWINLHGPGRWAEEGGEFSRTIHEEKFLKWGRQIRYFQFQRRP